MTQKEEVETCCVCHHPLANHIDEKRWWRCHSLGSDFYQCECRLQKFDDGIEQYSLEDRIAEQLQELKVIDDPEKPFSPSDVIPGWIDVRPYYLLQMILYKIKRRLTNEAGL